MAIWDNMRTIIINIYWFKISQFKDNRKWRHVWFGTWPAPQVAPPCWPPSVSPRSLTYLRNIFHSNYFTTLIYVYKNSWVARESKIRCPKFSCLRNSGKKAGFFVPPTRNRPDRPSAKRPPGAVFASYMFDMCILSTRKGDLVSYIPFESESRVLSRWPEMQSGTWLNAW